ncbi:Hypothetical protein PBC10988_8620 [Planctomycetales bacterium 10988]|nr:Hypothetical protein PBC10988_8620 [Planctomycetales bacterium 10988]
MTYSMHEEDLNEVRDEAMDVLHECREIPIPAARYDWLYRQNPDGNAALWSVRQQKTGKMVGFTVALPRRVLVDGQIRTAWNGADFSILKPFRALGIALKLRRAAKDGIDNGRADFLYAHPNSTMQVIHEKVGHRSIGTMVRYAIPLKSSFYIENRFGSRIAGRCLGPVVDQALRWTSPATYHRAHSKLTWEEAPTFDARFDRLFADAQLARPVIGVRDAAYLQWRYAENPLYPTHAVLAESEGKLRGFALIQPEGNVWHLKDVFCETVGTWDKDLLAAVLQQARRCGIASVSATFLDGFPLESTFTAFGFQRRSTVSQMMGYKAESDSGPELDSSAWWLSVGDRDV